MYLTIDERIIPIYEEALALDMTGKSTVVVARSRSSVTFHEEGSD